MEKKVNSKTKIKRFVFMLIFVFFFTTLNNEKAYGQLGSLGTLPKMPSLHSGILSPNGLTPAGEAVNFQFNTLYHIVKTIYLLDSTGEKVKELVRSAAGIEIGKEGFCYRFKERGLITLEVTVVDRMGGVKTTETQFSISPYGQEGDYCKPTYGGRIYSLANPEYIPEFEDETLDPWDDTYAGGNGLELSWKGIVWKESWSNILDQAISLYGEELLKESFVKGVGVEKLCPGFFGSTDDEKKRFWITFMAAIAYPESGYKPSAVFKEPAPLNKNSIGLFQLSFDDVRHEGGCNTSGLKSEEEILKDPATNIRCAVTIMRNQIEDRKTLWPKTFYYWSVLTTSKKIEVKSIFGAYKRNFLGFCN
jgi:hypothetical protein